MSEQQHTPIPVAPAPVTPETTGGDSGRPDPPMPQDQSDLVMDVFGLEGDWSESLARLEANTSAQGERESQGSAPPAPPAAAQGEGPATSATPTPAAAPTPDASQVPPQPGPAGTTPPAAAPVAPASAVPGVEPSVQALQAQVTALQTLLEQARAPASAQPQAGPAPASPASAEVIPPEQLMNYQVTIPNDVFAYLDSDEPQHRAMAMQHLVNSTARMTHERVIRHVDQLVNERLTAYGQYQTATAQQAEMQREYYGAFPTHNNPLTRNVVAMEAQKLFAENPTLEWNETTRNALGTRVNAALGIAAQQQVVTPPAANGNGATPPPAPAAMTGAHTRPAPSQAQQDGNFISSVLNAF